VSLFGESLPLDRFPEDPGIVGLGMSDWDGYASRLSRVFDYRNTFYDEPPQLDVMAPLPDELAASCDFVISSDVLEHVAPPYEQALANLCRLLKPGGFLVLTVPMKADGATDEHFPDLHQYDLATLGDGQVLVNRTRAGTIEIFEDLVFHGGPGATLEMRLFSLPDLLASLERVGFVDIARFDRAIPEHGILWDDPCGWPIVARAPR
jgi:SAM-dependent methyltransferase